MSHDQGIDYGHGQSNIDSVTGIRYGCISTNSLTAYFWDSVEHDYGPATCPVCGNHAVDFDDPSVPDLSELGNDEIPSYRPNIRCHDYWCASCEHTLDSSAAFPDEAIGWSIEETDQDHQSDSPEHPNANVTLLVVDCLDSDALVIKSQFYTYAKFCSPCVPGACSLDSPLSLQKIFPRYDRSSQEPVRCYCLDTSWFDSDRPCPYPYWDVVTDRPLYSPPALPHVGRFGKFETTGEVRLVRRGEWYLNDAFGDAVVATCDHIVRPSIILRVVALSDDGTYLWSRFLAENPDYSPPVEAAPSCVTDRLDEENDPLP